jgi:ATP-binding cassette subfamily B protein
MFSRIKALWALMHGHRLRYSLAMGAMVLSSLVILLQPLVTRGAIDYVITGKDLDAPRFVREALEALGGRALLRNHLWLVGGALVGVTLLSGAFMYLKGRYSAIASESICRDLRDRLYDHLQHLPACYYDQADTGDLVQRCSSDVETLRMFLSQQVVEIGRSVVLLLAVVPIMFALHVGLALWSMVLIGPIVLFALVFFSRVRHDFQRMDESEGAMTACIQENLTGIRVVRAFARGGFESRRFAKRNDDYRDKWYHLMRVMAGIWAVSDLMCLAQLSIVTVAGAFYLLGGGITVGTFFAFQMLVNQFLWPVRHMGRMLAETGKATVAIGRINEILQAPREQDAPEAHRADNRRYKGGIELRDVHFRHGSQAVLRGVSLKIPPGRSLAILGPSGSGKSTIINLLLRMYDYHQGQILLDGCEIRRMPRKLVRSQIGAVLQEPFLFSRTIRENIKLGRHNASDEEMVQAAADACLRENIEQFDEGYDTVVGERGVTLSGGQRQRVAIARALVKDPPILILDDALSAVDTRTEQMILDALGSRRGRHTTIVIAHRLSTLAEADEIIVLDHGRIAQQGDHESLMRQEGLYRNLWRIQSSLEEDLRSEMGSLGASKA